MIRFVPTKKRAFGVVSGQIGRSAIQRDPAAVGRHAEDDLYEQLDKAIAEEIVSGPRIGVIVPVLGRPQRVQPLLASFRNATSTADAEIYFVAQRSDTAEVDAIRSAGLEPLLVEDGDRSWAKKINIGFARTSEPWILLGADDLQFRHGWVATINDLLRQHRGVIGTNDLGNSKTMQGIASTHPLVRRAYARIFGTADERNKVVHEGYDHNFPDSELGLTAQRRQLYVHRTNCVIEHLHPLWGKAPSDPVYALGQRRWRHDQALFKMRCKKFGLA